MPILSMNMSTLAADLRAVPAGSPVHLSILTEQLPTDADLQRVFSEMRSAGIELLSAPKAVTLEWGDGYSMSGMDLQFRMPATPDPGTTGLLPLLLLGGIATIGLGYVVWKGGEITEDTVGSVVKMIFPMFLVGVGAYMLLNYSKRAG
jgi:hypothetical protein